MTKLTQSMLQHTIHDHRKGGPNAWLGVDWEAATAALNEQLGQQAAPGVEHVERVAQVLQETPTDWQTPTPWAMLSEDIRRQWRKKAIAALAVAPPPADKWGVLRSLQKQREAARKDGLYGAERTIAMKIADEVARLLAEQITSKPTPGGVIGNSASSEEITPKVAPPPVGSEEEMEMAQYDAWMAYCVQCSTVPIPPMPRDTFAAGWDAALSTPPVRAEK